MADRADRVFFPGPTAIHPEARRELRAAEADGFLSESHRGVVFQRTLEAMVEALRELLAIPSDYRILLVGSASEAMERIIQGTVRDVSGHLVAGAFARRMATISGNLGRTPQVLAVGDGESFRKDASRHPDFPLEAEILALTQNETSTGSRIPPQHLHALADEVRDREALVVVDLVSGWPTEGVDPARVDCGFFSVQKGFGLPAGLGVMVVSPRLVDRARQMEAEGHSTGGYFGIPDLVAAADRNQTRATPNMLAVRLLGAVAKAYARDGRDRLAAQGEDRARRFWQGIQGCSRLRPFVEDDELRSRTILVVDVEGRADDLREGLAQRGFLVGDGYGPWKGRHLRVANFPVQSSEMLEDLTRALQELTEG